MYQENLKANIKARIGAEAFQKLEGNIETRVAAGGSGDDEWEMADYLSMRFPPSPTAEEIRKKLEELSPPEPLIPKKKRGTPDWIRLNRIGLAIILMLSFCTPLYADTGASIQTANGSTLYLFKDGKVKTPSGETVYVINRDRIQTPSGSTLYRFSDRTIQSTSGATLCQFDGKEAKKRTGETVVRYSSSDVKTTTGTTLLRLKGTIPFPVLYVLEINKICK